MKIGLIIILVVISIVVGMALVGLALPRDHVARTRTAFRATPDQLWTAITDVNAFPKWRSDVKSVEMLPPVSGKLAWREDGSNGKISYEQVEAIRPSRVRVRLTDESLQFGGTWTYDIAPSPGGSELTITEDGYVRNPIFRFMSRFVFGHYSTQESYLKALGRKFNEKVSPQRL